MDREYRRTTRLRARELFVVVVEHRDCEISQLSFGNSGYRIGVEN